MRATEFFVYSISQRERLSANCTVDLQLSFERSKYRNVGRAQRIWTCRAHRRSLARRTQNLIIFWTGSPGLLTTNEVEYR